MSNLYRYRFGPAEFDESSGELSVNGLRVEIHPQGRALLSALLARRSEIMSRAELEAIVWKGGSASKEALATAINRLRNAFGASNAGLIETVPRQGYRVSAEGDRVVVGKAYESKLELQPGQPVPGRPHYLLERILGQSQSGEVWLARDSAGAGRVVKFATDAQYLSSLKRETTISRFLRDELGPRDDIALVLDWNFEQPPFLVESEYAGVNLQEWARAEGRLAALDADARLALFLQIADAVAAAHSVAVLHKDLKPGNILVSGQADGWRVKLADFGSARLLEPGRLDRLDITRLGMTSTAGIGSDLSQGTPLYLAPELLQDRPTTERSDVFALGVILYQLMVGDLKRPLVPGWQRDIGDALLAEDIAQATDGDPLKRTDSAARLAALLRALPRRRAEREAAAAAEAQALLERERVRRLRAQRPWIALSLLVLSAGLVASLWFYRQATRDQQALRQQVEVVQTMNRFLSEDLIAQADPAVSGRTGVTMLEAARKAAEAIDQRFQASAPEVQLALHGAMQQTFTGLTEYQAAIGEGRKALAAVQAMPQPDPLQLARIRSNLAMNLLSISSDKEAAVELDQVQRWLDAQGGRYPELDAQYWYLRGELATNGLDEKQGLAHFRRALGMMERVPQPPRALQERILMSYADGNRMSENYAEAEKVFQALIALQQQRYGASSPRSCYTRLGLASTYTYQERMEDISVAEAAARCLEAALGMNNARTGTGYEILGSAYFKHLRYKESAEANLKAAEVYGKLEGAHSFHSLTARITAARSLGKVGDSARAESLLVAALADARVNNQEDSPMVQAVRYHLARCRLDQRHSDGVAALLRGLDAEALNHSEIEPDWEQRLATEHKRLRQLAGAM